MGLVQDQTPFKNSLTTAYTGELILLLDKDSTRERTEAIIAISLLS